MRGARGNSLKLERARTAERDVALRPVVRRRIVR